jgi:hypothetical protein
VITGWANAASRPDKKIRTPQEAPPPQGPFCFSSSISQPFFLPPEHP